ncbi:MAG: hypothetical protein ABIC95_01320 [archaeon]
MCRQLNGNKTLTSPSYVMHYHYVRRFSKNLIRLLKLKDLVQLDLAENLLCKIGGYNVELGFALDLIDFFNNKNKPLWKRFLYRLLLFTPIVNKHIFYHIFKRKEYELSLDKIIDLDTRKKKYDNIYFASMNNYLNPLLDFMKKRQRNLLIVPLEAKNWSNYSKLLKKKVDFVYLQSLVEYDKNKINSYEKFIRNEYQRKKANIIFFERKNLACTEMTLKEFLFDFVPKHIVVVNSLYRWLTLHSHKHTSFHVSRDRRALENAFLQIGNKISGETNILNHGLISSNFDKHLWYRFDMCKNIYVYGKYDKNVIIMKQEALDETCPNLIVVTNNFFNYVKKEKQDTVLFIGGGYINRYIGMIVNSLADDYKIVIRLHPGEQNLVTKYKKYEMKESVTIDDLKSSIYPLFKNARVVLSFSSTSVLESIQNDIPVFILDFNGLDRQLNIFKEARLIDFKDMMVTENDLQDKIKKLFNDKQYEKRILTINRKLYDYFVG